MHADVLGMHTRQRVDDSTWEGETLLGNLVEAEG